jgi:hypothetical protein
MFRRLLTILAATCGLSAYADSGLKNVDLHDLFFGEVLYYAYQDRYFDALNTLDTELNQYHHVDEPQLDPFHYHQTQAEFSVGDIELQYRMNQRAGRAIQAVLGEGVDLATRNQAALALARVYYKKNDPVNALYALELIRDQPEQSRYDARYSLDNLRGKEPETFGDDVAYLKGLASLRAGHFDDAVNILQTLVDEPRFKGYVQYNLGIALLQRGGEGDEARGIQVLDKLGTMETDQDDLLNLKDKTNLKLAYYFLDKKENKDAARAEKYFNRVRLDGPFSDRALLGAGWVAVAQGKYDRALVPWTILHDRSETNVSVQEAQMAVPFAYSKLQAFGRAANLYNHAMDVFAREIKSLDDSIKSIRKGKFLVALLDDRSNSDKDWVVNLRKLDDTPETHYLLDLMASRDFQESYKNYKDLADLRRRIDKWLDDLRVFEELIEKRRAYQEPLLPVVEEEFKKLDARVKLRLEQREALAKKIKNLLIAPRPEYVATANERQASDRIKKLQAMVAKNPKAYSDEIKSRLNRLQGILLWQVDTNYDQRLTDAYNNLIALDKLIDKMKLRYYSFIRTRQAATQSYEGYTIPIRQFRTRLFETKRKLKGIMAKQGRMLETMAINELDQRRKRLEDYQIKARFALAESYDRATKAESDAEIEAQRKAAEEAEKKNAGQAQPQSEGTEQKEPEQKPEQKPEQQPEQKDESTLDEINEQLKESESRTESGAGTQTPTFKQKLKGLQ